MPSKVEEILEEYRKAVLSRDAAAAREYARQWLKVEQVLEGQYLSLAMDVNDLRQAGYPVTDYQVMQLQRYQQLLGQTRTEMERFSRFVEGGISSQQYLSAQDGLDMAHDTLMQTAIGKGITLSNFNRLPIEAVKNMMGMSGNGSPLRELLMADYGGTMSQLTSALISGVALGYNPRKTARSMAEAMAGNLQRALLVSRAETMRALRTAQVQQYRATGFVRQYMRKAAMSTRTCLACLLEDGRVYSVQSQFSDHPNGRCFSVAVLEDAPDHEMMSGKEYLEKLQPEEQKGIMGEERWNMWKGGQIKLEQMSGMHNHPTWGESPKMVPMKELANLVDQLPKTAGISFYKSEKYGAVDQVARAVEVGNGTDGWKENGDKLAQYYLPKFDLEDDVEYTIGLWETPEPSFNLRVRGSRENLVGMGKAWGRDYQQKDVVLMVPKVNGKGGILAWDFGRQLSHGEWDQVLGGLMKVNEELASLPDGEWVIDFLGASVRGKQTMEYWYKDQDVRESVKVLINKALKKSGLGIELPLPSYRDGFEFISLGMGKDY
jgi:hypothetical protein